MKLGAHIGQQGMTMEDLRRVWRRFDTAGIDWISLWDHLYEAPPAGGTIDHFETVAALGALCAETEHARIGCLVFCVAYRNPALIAKTAATLDHISGGRFELGLGAGWHEQEARAFGFDFPPLRTRFDMLDEAVQIVRSMLEEGRTTFEGQWFRTDDVANVPAPIQSRLPIWIGGIGETRTLPLAARTADGWNAAYVSPAEFSRLNDVLDRECEKNDRDPSTIRRGINLQFVVGANHGEAARLHSETAAFWGPMADRAMGGALIGTPDDVVEQLEEYREARADSVNIALRAPWSDEAVEGYLEAALPHFRT